MNAPTVLELPLDDALLKVLSSESRREILRLLRERRMTGAELAARLELGKPAVAEHLKKLQDAELIERFDDPERRWVYYSLSARGRGILEPQRVRFYLVMAVAAMALMVGVTLALGLVVLMQSGGAVAGAADGTGAGGANLGAGGDAGLGSVSALPTIATTSTSAPPTSPPAAAGGNGTLNGTRGDPIYTGANRQPTPVGAATDNTTASPGALALLLDDDDIARLRPDLEAGEAPVLIYVYRPQDLDVANGTVRLHRLTVDDAALAGHNLTEALSKAAVVQGVGFLLEVPDAMDLPERQNGTTSIAFDPAALPAAPPANGTASDPAAGNATAPSGPGATAQDAGGSAAPTGTEPVGTAPTGATSQPAPTGTPSDGPAQGDDAAPSGEEPAPDPTGGKPVDDAVATSTRTLPQGAGQGTRAGQEVREGPQAFDPAAQAAPIPLVALLAAALMVSIYIPMRRR